VQGDDYYFWRANTHSIKGSFFKIFGGQCLSFWIFIFYLIYKYSIEVDEEQILHTTFRLGFACGFVGWMWASSLDARELY
jgi:hypothetical protein